MLTKELLKSLLAFASKDVTRLNLNCIHFDGARAVATDGRALVAHDCMSPVATITRASLERLARIIPRDGAELLPDMTCAGLPLETTDAKFPPWEAVLPAIAAYSDYKRAAVKVDSQYLTRLSLVQAACDASGVVVTAGAELDPIRCDVAGPLGTAVAVIMPMRCK